MAIQLLQLVGGDLVTEDVLIKGLTNDSRAVSEGDLFVALPGTKVDGRGYISDALANGAVAVLTSRLEQSDKDRYDVPIIEDANPRRRYAELAARFCGPQPSCQVAVTGTNGKTSVVDFTRQIWEQLGIASASLGTLGVRSKAVKIEGGLTTPDPMALYGALAQLKNAGVDHVAVEASSHGLDQFRLDGARLAAAAFTNLTRDHLDYHRTEQAYFYAKARLFGELLSPGGTAVVNIDDPWGAIVDDIAWGRSLTRLSYGKSCDAHLRIADVKAEPLGQRVLIDFQGKNVEVKLPLVGGFQALNAVAAAGLVIACGAETREVFAALSYLNGVPGRLELVGEHNGAGLYVDYAHTPDGLKTVLAAARAHGPRKLHVVFGCGGDRDVGKRPQMGQIASELADFTYVTDDNPRSEDPAVIRAQILSACEGAIEIADRAAAISAAAAAAEPGDMVIIAGKGHETGQILADRVIDYSDIETVRAIVGAVNQNQEEKG